MTHNVTIFKDLSHTNTPFHKPVGVVLDRIKDGASKDLVKRIRAEKRKNERQELKKKLPAICFSGTFNKRSDNSLIEHSGLLCLDFDNYESQKEMLQAKEMMVKNRFVYSVFVSPSGDGLKVLVRIPDDQENHVNYFNSLGRYFDDPHFDKTSKNLSRVCFESYDPLIHVNENSSTYDIIDEPEYKEVTKSLDAPTIPITDETKIVDILVKWWEKKYPMVKGERNTNMFVLCAALNEFGVNKEMALYICLQYETDDFLEKEIRVIVNSAYKDTAAHGTKQYEDKDRVEAVKSKMRRGATKKEVRATLQEEGLENTTIDSVLNRLEEENTSKVFWKKSDKGSISIDHMMFKHFLEENGFYKFCPEGGKNHVFVRVTNNLVDHAMNDEIKDFILNHLYNNVEDTSIYNYFADNTRFFKQDFLTLLGTINIYFVGDTKDAAYLYYRNCAVRVTKEGVQALDYWDLGGYVWKDHVIDRVFSPVEINDTCYYRKFISNVCGKDVERVKSMESTIGFMMHGFKNLSYCPAMILNDELISDNPEGGTGKGIFINALSQMKKVVIIDGKAFSPEKNFPYQLVSADTQILCFDDVKKHFDFEKLFSVVSEGITLEKKNKDAIKIPFDRSPKIAITTNYAIKGVGNSFARRKWELELHQYYKKSFTPFHEFGKMFFTDWSDDEWRQYDNYMLGCVVGYLNTGLVESKFINLKVRQLAASACHEFIEWCGLINNKEENHMLLPGNKWYKKDMFDSFVADYPDYGKHGKLSISSILFYRWLDNYSIYKYSVKPREGRDATGKWIQFITRHQAETQEKLDV